MFNMERDYCFYIRTIEAYPLYVFGFHQTLTQKHDIPGHAIDVKLSFDKQLVMRIESLVEARAVFDMLKECLKNQPSDISRDFGLYMYDKFSRTEVGIVDRFSV